MRILQKYKDFLSFLYHLFLIFKDRFFMLLLDIRESGQDRLFLFILQLAVHIVSLDLIDDRA